jgi:uncharacterized protein related to proFAR isomerase
VSGGTPKGRGPGERPRGPWLVPILLLGSSGRVMAPGEEGPVEARLPDGSRPDLFDLTDYLSDRFRRLYVVDLDGIERDRPQLDYLQELTRDTDVWVDGGVRSADAVIDVLVAGARRAVVSTGYLPGPDQLARAWKFSPEIVLELEIDDHGSIPRPDWEPDPVATAAAARSLGLTDLIVAPRGERAIDWELVRKLAETGPTWVGGRFEPSDEPRLPEVHAAGGFFHLGEVLAEFAARPTPR